ncbi:HAMP domain-containing sensor histidine kinase [Paenibacillus sp. strain BS8-2]
MMPQRKWDASRLLPMLLSRLPFPWRMTFLAAALLSLLMSLSNITQYVFVERWMIGQEEVRIRQDMRELLNLLLAKEIDISVVNETQLRLYLERANVRGGMITLRSSQGEAAIVVADNVPDRWEETLPRSNMELGSVHYESGMLALRSPITIFNFQGSIEMVRSMEEVERLIAHFYKIMLICCCAAVIISVAGGRLLAIGLIRPLRAMNATMSRVRQNGLQERMPVALAKDEITALQSTFNGMMDEVEKSFDKQKRFVEDASHELRTPIAIVEGHLRMLSRWGKADVEVLDNALRISTEEIQRLKRLVDHLLVLSRAEQSDVSHPLGIQCEQPSDVIEEAVEKCRRLHPDFEWDVDVSGIKGAIIAFDEHELAQLIHILLDNAVKYSGGGRKISVAAYSRGTSAVITVEDQGIGITQEDLPRVWDRFYRADKARSGGKGGYGLGLPIARSLVRNHGGDIRLESTVGEGTKVVVELLFI